MLSNDGRSNNQPIRVGVNDSVGLLVEIASPVDSSELQSNFLIWSKSMDVYGLQHANRSEPLNTSFAYDGQLDTHVEVVTVDDDSGWNELYWSLVKDYIWNDQPPIMRLHRYDESSVECTSLSRAGSAKVTTLKVLGYGRMSFPDGPISYSSLRSADVNYLLSDVCNEKYLNAPSTAVANKIEGVIVTSDMLCANDNKDKQDVYSGDSWGPLLAQIPVFGGR
jgi:hypothetical protein